MNKKVIFQMLFFCTFLISTNTFGFSNGDPKVKSNSNNNTEPLAVCNFSLTPDLPLLASSTAIESEIIGSVKIFANRYLGNTAPTAAQLTTAINQYNTYLKGVAGSDLSRLSFLLVFARELKANPANTTVAGYADNAINVTSQAICDNTIDEDVRGYSYRTFGRAAVLLAVMDGANIIPAVENTILSAETKAKFAYTLWLSTRRYQHYWATDTAYATNQVTNDAIDTDVIYNKSDIMLAYCLFPSSMDERYRYMRGYQRYLNRFLSVSSGTANGIKKDGSGFHHWTAYNSYMYAYQSVVDNMLALDGTRFQIGVGNYKRLRDAALAQRLQSTDGLLQALSTCGRKPNERTAQMPNADISSLAILGGKILGLSNADPILAGFYNRVNGIANSAFNYSTKTPFEEGFIQMNYSNLGVYRKIGADKNWVAVTKGFTRGLWGAETYPNENRYGRYQAYGSLEIMYPGTAASNGYGVTTWNWNYSPGATVIELPWGLLHSERSRLDEYQNKHFAGTLTFKQKKLDYLSETYGEFGMFGMDFQQRINLGFDIVHGPEAHNNTFVFKKSNFFFDDVIVSLGSGISNNDVDNRTVTTLYQRISNSVPVMVNGTAYSTDGIQTISGSTNNWIVDNYGTGFYVMADSGNALKVIKGDQRVPQHTVIWNGTLPTTNALRNYYIGYIDHGTNPSNRGYEYILKPNTTDTEMQTLDTQITAGNKPYTVHQRDLNAHIIEHKAKKIFGYCAFTSLTNITVGNIKSINSACLVMADNSVTGKLLLSLSNPDLGFVARSYQPSVTKIIDVVLDGQWTIDSPTPGVVLVSSDTTQTLLRFTTIDGNAYELSLTDATLGVKSDTILEQSVQLYPNPNQGKFNLNYNGSEALKKLEIFSITGQLIKVIPLENVTNQTEINVPELKSGLYLVNIKTESATAIKKIIIE